MEGEKERVAALVNRRHRPPMIWVDLPNEQVQAALLIWARSDSGWRAGVCYLHHTWHTRALVTTWGHQRYAYARSKTGRYDEVHRIRLHGDPSQWQRYRRATPAPASGG